MGSGIVGSVEAVLEELLTGLDARRAVLILSEEGSDRRFVWEMTAGDDTSVRRVRPLGLDDAGAAPFTFAIPAGANAWYAERPAAGDARRVVIVAVDGLGRTVAVRPPLEPLCGAPFPWASVHCLSSIAGDGWSGRLFVFDSRARRARTDQLRFLQVVLTHVGPALFNLYLQRRTAVAGRRRRPRAHFARTARRRHPVAGRRGDAARGVRRGARRGRCRRTPPRS